MDEHAFRERQFGGFASPIEQRAFYYVCIPDYLPQFCCRVGVDLNASGSDVWVQYPHSSQVHADIGTKFQAGGYRPGLGERLFKERAVRRQQLVASVPVYVLGAKITGPKGLLRRRITHFRSSHSVWRELQGFVHTLITVLATRLLKMSSQSMSAHIIFETNVITIIHEDRAILLQYGIKPRIF